MAVFNALEKTNPYPILPLPNSQRVFGSDPQNVICPTVCNSVHEI